MHRYVYGRWRERGGRRGDGRRPPLAAHGVEAFSVEAFLLDGCDGDGLPPDVLPDVGELVHAQRLEQIRIGAGEDALLHEVDRLVRRQHDH